MNIKWDYIKEYSDIKFEFYNGVAKITINRPKVYNAFRPETNIQMLEAIDICRERNDIDIVVFTGEGEKAFCSGGDRALWRRKGGMQDIAFDIVGGGTLFCGRQGHGPIA